MTAPAGATTAGLPTAAPRLVWVDAARGYSVAAVVLFHVILWHFGDLQGPQGSAGDTVWTWVNAMLGSVRMPVLLAVSGLVLARRIRSGPLFGGTFHRAVGTYYLYVVWLAVYAGFYTLVSRAALPHRVDGPGEVLTQLVLPATTLWYLFALALYVIVLTAVRDVPPWVVLTVLAGVTTLVHSLGYEGLLWPRVPELLFFFALGVYGAERLRRLAEGAGAWTVGLAAVVAMGITLMGRLTRGPVDTSLLFIVRGTAFLVLATVTVGVAVRWSPLRRLGLTLGRQTLGVYVLHPLLIALAIVLVANLPGTTADDFFGRPVVALVYPPLLTALIIACSLPVRSVAERVHLGWLFQMPARWALFVARSTTPAGAHESAGARESTVTERTVPSASEVSESQERPGLSEGKAHE